MEIKHEIDGLKEENKSFDIRITTLEEDNKVIREILDAIQKIIIEIKEMRIEMTNADKRMTNIENSKVGLFSRIFKKGASE